MLNAEFCGIDLGFDRFGEIDPMLAPNDTLRTHAPLQDRPGYNLALAALNRLDRTVLPWLADHRADPFVLFVHTYVVHNYQPEPKLLAEFTRDLPESPLRLTGRSPTSAALSDAWLTKQGHGDERFAFAGAGDHASSRRATCRTSRRSTTRPSRRPIATSAASSARSMRSASRRARSSVVTADHGEEFLEHGDLGHARSLFDEILRVPLLIRVPGVAPRRIDEPVELIDLAPTLLARLGLPKDPRMRGSDLLAGRWEPRSITIHEGIEVGGSPDHTLRAARARGSKLVLLTKLEPHAPGFVSGNVRDQLAQLGYVGGGIAAGGFFDLQHDPAEQIDLLKRGELEPPQSAKLHGPLARAARSAARGRGGEQVSRRDGNAAIVVALACAGRPRRARPRARGAHPAGQRPRRRCGCSSARSPPTRTSRGRHRRGRQSSRRRFKSWRFRGNRSGWLLLDSGLRPVAPDDATREGVGAGAIRRERRRGRGPAPLPDRPRRDRAGRAGDVAAAAARDRARAPRAADGGAAEGEGGAGRRC
jgi:hypothetical protein